MMDVDTLNPSELKKAGFEALTKALGPVGMMRFLQLLQKGYGDYTRDRDLWLKDQDLDTVLQRIEDRREGSK